jgi:lipid A disaccharide synthetase
MGNFSKLLDKITFAPAGDSIDARPAIMSSDAISLKDCQKGIPGAIVFQTHPLTYGMGKMLINVKHLGTSNILRKVSKELEKTLPREKICPLPHDYYRRLNRQLAMTLRTRDVLSSL